MYFLSFIYFIPAAYHKTVEFKIHRRIDKKELTNWFEVDASQPLDGFEMDFNSVKSMTAYSVVFFAGICRA